MNVPVFTVSEITKHIKQSFMRDPILQNIHIKGEISNFHRHSRGHAYFTLKDEKSLIRCIMFNNHYRLLSFTPENGMKVITAGRISVYERDGTYQLYVVEMQPDGIGSLHIAFEQLKKKLEKEGLFLDKNKKPLPFYPRVIGVVTSPTGAAVKDIITVIKRRCANVDIIVVPALVQGPEAPASIAEGIRKLNKFKEVDLIIVGRGGGSLEELWAFNTETVARSIFESKIPIVSAVGHERDYTISDFVADLRAPTPSSAGELVVPETRELKEKLKQLQSRLIYSIKNVFTKKRHRVIQLLKQPPLRNPREMTRHKMREVVNLTKNLIYCYKYGVKTKKQLFTSLTGKLDALSPLAVISRGYSICQRLEDKKIVRGIEDVNTEDLLEVLLKNGILNCRVYDKKRGMFLWNKK